MTATLAGLPGSAKLRAYARRDGESWGAEGSFTLDEAPSGRALQELQPIAVYEGPLEHPELGTIRIRARVMVTSVREREVKVIASRGWETAEDCG